MTTGQVRGEGLECGYHGLTFDGKGACLRLPGRDQIPGAFTTRAYPVVEKWRYVFIWMGDSALADESTIPDFHWSDDLDWYGRGETLPVKCHATLLRDNLLDLSHAHFVHTKTLATDAVLQTPMEVYEKGGELHVLRLMENIEPSPFFKHCLGGYEGRVTYRQLIRFIPASTIIIESCSWNIDNPEHRAEFRVMNGLTPETDRSSLYFWSLARNFDLGNDALGGWIFNANKNTFFEDVDVIEKQQIMLERAPEPERQLLFHVDAGVNAARKLMARLFEQENAA
jgi:phenylpropionate dioxygenase-like ring-hydroxylating dioxygenase large terminal subunit